VVQRAASEGEKYGIGFAADNEERESAGDGIGAVCSGGGGRRWMDSRLKKRASRLNDKGYISVDANYRDRGGTYLCGGGT